MTTGNLDRSLIVAHLRRIVLMPALICFATACATYRGTLNIEVPVPDNPASETVFQAPQVMDARQFEADPRDPSTPSLKNAEEITDEQVTARAIARKRNGYGMAMGDILLPEGRTVSQLASDAIVRGIRDAGFRVVQPGDAAYSGATPVRARIQQFWAWITPGFWAMAIEFKADVNLTADFGSMARGEPVNGYIRLKSSAASSEKWRNTIERGLEDFSANVRTAFVEAAKAEPESAEPSESFDACFEKCVELTGRTRGECFDACR